MRAVVIDRFGGPEELHVAELPTPEPGEGEVLLRVAAAGVNPIDYKMRDGSSKAVAGVDPEAFPVVLGREASGVVEAVGAGVGHVATGDTVFAINGHGCLRGSYAEYAIFPAEGVVHAPEGIDTDTLAGTPLAGLTAWAAVHDLAKVTSDDVVLVHGGGGGVGQMIVQLCVAAGATVYATASARNHDRLQALGATHVDYNSEDFTQVTPRPTVIIDGVWFGTYEPSMDHLAEGGRLVILPTLADLEPAQERGIDVSVVSFVPDPDRLTALAGMLADGTLTVEVGAVFRLEEAADAHRLLEDGHAKGKVVLRVSAPLDV